jgi:formimidoylglutamate deiminase
VSLGTVQEVVGEVSFGAPEARVHIHVAEQRREVEDCVATYGQRPVELLLNHRLVDRRWSLIHAMHAELKEIRGVIDADAVIGLCPTTEGNLGDGRFPLDELLASDGHFGIGSDSQVSIDPAEELRIAEYAIGAWRERRLTSLAGAAQHAGTLLYQRAQAGGARSMGSGPRAWLSEQLLISSC